MSLVQQLCINMDWDWSYHCIVCFDSVRKSLGIHLALTCKQTQQSSVCKTCQSNKVGSIHPLLHACDWLILSLWSNPVWPFLCSSDYGVPRFSIATRGRICLTNFVKQHRELVKKQNFCPTWNSIFFNYIWSHISITCPNFNFSYNDKIPVWKSQNKKIIFSIKWKWIVISIWNVGSKLKLVLKWHFNLNQHFETIISFWNVIP